MKNTLASIFISAALSTSALAQGIITMNPGPGYPIWYSVDKQNFNLVPVGSPSVIPGVGKLNVALYSAPVGTGLAFLGGVPSLGASSGWTIQTSPLLQSITDSPGTLAPANVTLGSGSAGQPVELTVVAWTGEAPSFDEAFWGHHGTVMVGWPASGISRPPAGGATYWQNDTGTDVAPANIRTGVGAFSGLTLSFVPEPSASALAGLGVATLLILRHRKGNADS